jgi:hypothetical protein
MSAMSSFEPSAARRRPLRLAHLSGGGLDEEQLPFDLHIVGEVKAGQVDEYELRGDVGEWIAIPKIGFRKKVFGYRVVGKSMEQEGLYEKDYIIVEGFESSWWPRQNEMIVTRYLPENPERRQDFGETGDAQMVGPTVKVFAEIQEDDGPVYRLSWKKARGNRLYEIKTHKIAPIGRVIGVYRPVEPHP